MNGEADNSRMYVYMHLAFKRVNMIQCDGCSEWYHEECERSILQNTLHGSQKTQVNKNILKEKVGEWDIEFDCNWWCKKQGSKVLSEGKM